ncbi:MAG: hypothetical protein F8N37_08605 [Telmatospirillum sp.]|nr:hypothetical protein [Telmatospirillum sp.]
MLLTLLAAPSQATTLNELRVAVRIFDFMIDPPRGRTPLAVIFDGQNKASQEDAVSIGNWLNSGISSEKAQFIPILVDVLHLSEVPYVRVGIVAGGASAHFERVLDYALKNHTVTISSDMGCMQSGICTVGIAGTPRVEVVINRAVAASCGVEFSEAFRLMVREY